MRCVGAGLQRLQRCGHAGLTEVMTVVSLDSRAGFRDCIWFGPVRSAAVAVCAFALRAPMRTHALGFPCLRSYSPPVPLPSNSALPSTTHLIIMAEQSPAWLDKAKGSGAAAPAPGPVADVAAADIAVSSAEAPAASSTTTVDESDLSKMIMFMRVANMGLAIAMMICSVS